MTEDGLRLTRKCTYLWLTRVGRRSAKSFLHKCTYLWLTRVGRRSAKSFLHKCLEGTSVLNGQYHSLTWPDLRSDGRVMCSLQMHWFFEEQDEATTGFSLPNTEVHEDSSFSRMIELLTGALSSRLLWISRVIETSTYFQCIVPGSVVPVRVYDANWIW